MRFVTATNTLRSSNMAMENTLFISDCPIEAPISSGFPIATFDDTGGYYLDLHCLQDTLTPHRELLLRVLGAVEES